MTKLTALLVLLAVLQLPNIEALEVHTEPLHECLSGDSVVLQCTYETPDEFADQYIITWSYIEEDSSKTIIFINNDGEEQSFDEYVGRVSSYGEYASLQIDDVVIKDTGNYECDVDYYVSSYQGVATTHLEVYQIVESVDILDIEDGDYHLVEGGKELTMTCVAQNGYPEAQLGWYKDDQYMTKGDISFIDNNDGTYSSHTVLTFVPTTDHDGVVVRCQSNQEPEIKGVYVDDHFFLSVSGAGFTSFSTVLLVVSVLFSTL